MNQIANKLMPSDLVAEYDNMQSKLPDVYEQFISSRDILISSCSVMGSYGGNIWRNNSNPEPSPHDLQKVLKVSAWNRVYNSWIKDIATAKDKDKIEVMLESPPEFTIDNLRLEFGDYVQDPWGTILRGLAEVFCGLDPFYKSHTKVGIGKTGLPKRIIISHLSSFHNSRSMDRLRDVVDALRAYRRQPLTNYGDVRDWIKAAQSEPSDLKTISGKDDGLKLKLFNNGNGHVFFDKNALNDINKALSDFYGEVLPDVDVNVDKKQASTEISKDLQYYPTPIEVVKHIFYDIRINSTTKVLEPSCGCGRILDHIKVLGAQATGIEYDSGRANEARSKGHNVLIRNFLEVEPTNDFDLVVMNPPFYGKHYIKHIEAALRWLKDGGTLVSILPISARYDHDLINKQWLDDNNASCSRYNAWRDLPVGSFSESGTNINTTVLTLFKGKS